MVNEKNLAELLEKRRLEEKYGYRTRRITKEQIETIGNIFVSVLRNEIDSIRDDSRCTDEIITTLEFLFHIEPTSPGNIKNLKDYFDIDNLEGIKQLRPEIMGWIGTYIIECIGDELNIEVEKESIPKFKPTELCKSKDDILFYNIDSGFDSLSNCVQKSIAFRKLSLADQRMLELMYSTLNRRLNSQTRRYNFALGFEFTYDYFLLITGSNISRNTFRSSIKRICDNGFFNTGKKIPGLPIRYFPSNKWYNILT